MLGYMIWFYYSFFCLTLKMFNVCGQVFFKLENNTFIQHGCIITMQKLCNITVKSFITLQNIGYLFFTF